MCGDGLMGADREYAPYFMVHGTFGEYKVKDRLGLELVSSVPRQLRPYQQQQGQQQQEQEELYEYDDKLNTYRSETSKNFRLEHLGQETTRVDESINIELWCHTRLSGIKELDKRESAYAERQVSCGVFQLSVAQIIGLFKKNNLKVGQPFVVEASIVDDKIIETVLMEYIKADGVGMANNQQGGKPLTRELYQQYVQRAIDETHKARVKFELCMNAFSEPLYTGSVFNIQDFQTKTCMATSSFVGGGNGSNGINAKTVSSTLRGHPISVSGLPNSRPHQPQGAHRDALHPPQLPSVVVYEPNGRGPRGDGSGIVDWMAPYSFQPLSHTSALGFQKLQETMHQCVLSTYCRAFMRLDARDPEPLYGPSDQVVKNLQFPQWISKMGKELAISYFSCHDPSTRIYSSEAAKLEDLQRYGFKADTEQHFIMMAQSALRSRGLTANKFEEVVRTHFSTENKSRDLDPLFLLCEDVVARLGTFAANSAYYTADYRMVRKLVMGNKAKMIVLDSWDNTILNNSGRSDDCEGQDNTATTIIRAFGTGRHELGFKWESSLLDAIQLYLKHTIIYDIGGTVTSAFVDNSNKAVDLHKIDLPMNDDAMDLRSKSDGHCFGMQESQTNCIKRLEQGNIGASRVALIKSMTLQDAAFQERDGKRGVLILEGTGTIEPRILPVDETYAGHDQLRNKNVATRRFVKTLQSRLKQRKEQHDNAGKQAGGVGSTHEGDEVIDIAGMFHGEGMPHYVQQQHPQRRISDFYKQPVMGCSVELYQRFGIAGSQFAFTRRGDDGKHRYGVKVADFMRTTDRYALIFPFANCNEEWHQKVTQLSECVQHQLPMMAFGRYTKEQYQQTHSAYMRGSAPSQQAFEELVYQVATSSHLSLARLQMRLGDLEQSKQKTEAMFSFIGESPGLVAYGVYAENHLPICNDIVEVLVVTDTAKCLDLEEM